MVDREVMQRLGAARVSYCLIGCLALAEHGVALRESDARVELLTVDTDVLRPLFWDEGRRPEADLGEAGADSVGRLRWAGSPAQELLVGRGHAMVFALDTAHPNDHVGCRVATPLGLLLVALQREGIGARVAIDALIRAQGARLGAPWPPPLEGHLASMAPSATAAWNQIVRNR
jgi:hypothetical protein